jgi:hypothetical protein
MTTQPSLWSNRWVRLPLGFAATSLASLLAFYAGHDIAEMAFGKSTAEASAVTADAPFEIVGCAKSGQSGYGRKACSRCCCSAC